MSHMEEGGLKNFTNSVIFLVKLFAGLKDKFLAQKLYDKISEFVAGYIKLFNSKGGGVESESTSHNMRLRDLLNSLDGLLELLDYLEHSKLVSATPLLYARKNLLNFKLNLIKLRYQPIQSVPKPKESGPVVPLSKNIQLRNLKESSNKERIFNFIKHSPNSRTKEIIEEFNILSERTVKRNLKELTTEGVVRKWAKDNGVYYLAI
mgnify:FL=1